jgi:hypothetical protein
VLYRGHLRMGGGVGLPSSQRAPSAERSEGSEVRARGTRGARGARGTRWELS